MDQIRNPYAPGAGSPPPELAGRKDVIENVNIALQRLLLNRPSQSPILVGLRGVGKTVLLVKLQSNAENFGLKTINIEAHEGKSLPELIIPGIRKVLFSLSTTANAKDKVRRAFRVLKSFLNSIKVTISDFDVGMSIDSELGTADSGDIEVDLPELIVALGEAALASGNAVVIFIDEMQYLSEKEFSSLIMSIHQVSQKSLPILLIGAGLPQILALAGNSKSYAERLFSYPNIGALSEEDAANAIVAPAKTEGVIIEQAAVNQILKVTKRYPYFLQQWAYECWKVAENDIIKASDVFMAHNNAIATLDDSFFKVRFERCTQSEKKYMRALAGMGSGAFRSGDIANILGMKSTSLAPVRSKLIKKGMIYSPAHGDTEFTVPLFDEYMLRAMPSL
jgi:AAA ATPase domain